MLLQLLLPLEDDDGALSPNYQPWGFTLYRTKFGDTDPEWQTVLDTIHSEVRAELGRCAVERTRIDQDSGAEVRAAETLLSLFRLDVRSEPEHLLSGQTVEQLRDMYSNDAVPGGPPMDAWG